MNTTPIIGGSIPLELRRPDTSEISKATRGFSDILTSTITQVSGAEASGNTAIEKLNTGEAKNLHEVMIAVEEADISLRMLVQMRNKALEAYEQILRMQL